jgi:hypothetical protein
MELIPYQALISHSDNLKRMREAQAKIAHIGGKVVIEPPNHLGMTLVTLWLPSSYTPEQVVPGIPFYPM